MAQARKERWRSIAVGLASTLLALAGADRALCLVYPPFAIGGSVLVPDQSIGWKLRPNHVIPERGLRINSAGFRGEEFHPRAERPLAAFVGDSVTYGAAGQDYTFPRLFEEITGWTSQNYGVPYYGPLEYEKVLPTALGFRPDLVVVGLFVGNDVVDCAPRSTAFIAHELGTGRPSRRWSWSGIYRFLLFRGILDWRLLRGPAADDPEPAEQPSEDRFTAMELSRVQVYRPTAYVDNWQCLGASLRRMSALHPNLVVLIVPDQLQVDDALWSRVIKKAARPEQFDRLLPNRRIGELAHEIGLRVVDATPVLKASPESTYIRWDSHPNREGNRRIAHALAESLGRFPSRGPVPIP